MNISATAQNNMTPHLKKGERAILFDGVCKLCNAWSNFIIQHDKHRLFQLSSVQSQEGKDILRHFNYPTETFDTMLVVNDKRSYEKSDAFFMVMKTLGYPYKLVTVFQILPRSLRDWMYDRVALNRYTLFGKYDYCSLPNPDHDKRYLGTK
ncbi:thiol-disulfide oxidoreductase DCC family protein [Ningiella sp. W23]|uniref:thiol-disulfide oxidoreductase DCC family protein n=1 Tax=Ningiella sp. W23 TaxID=3023715 RepID=UPI0039F4A41D